MSWPLSHDYNEAIQNPKIVFSDPDLKAGDTVVGARGLPLPRSGNFADVYQVRGSDGSSWAVKCFTRPVVGLDERYARVSAALAEAKLPFVIGFTFLGEGIRVGGAWRPVVKMEWVEGLLLNQVVRENAARTATLASLGQMWVRLCKRLREARIAHADIQHGNVLLVPGSRPGAYGLKLIDYDGMHVPALANQPSGEVGHPAYQHPARAATRAYSPDLDRFPHLVVLTALKALETGGSALWDRYDTGDNLLFTEEDFRKPDGSKLMRELWLMDNPSVQALVGQLAISCGKPIPRTPWIDEIAPEGEVKSLDPATRQAAAEAIGVPLPVPAALPPEPAHGAPAPAVVPLSLDDSAVASGQPDRHAEVNVELVAEDTTAPRPREYRKTTEKETSRTHIPLIAGGLLLLGGVATVAILMSRGKKDSVDTVQKPNDVDTKPRQVIDPKGKGQVAPIGPNGTEPKGKEPIEKKSDPPKLQPLELKPVGNLAVKQRWTAELGNDQSISRLASSLDSATIVFRGIKSGSFCLDAAAGQKVPDSSNTFFTPIRSAIPLNDGKFAAPQPFGDTPTPIWDSKARKAIEPLKPFERLSRVRGNAFVSRDIRYLAFGVMGAQNTPAPFMLADLGTGKTVLDFDCVWGQALFPADSRRVLVTERSGNCRWFKLPSGEPDGEWSYRPRATGSAGPIAISADGNVLLHEGQLVDHDATYHVLDARTGAVLHSFPGLFRAPFGNPLSDDGRMVALVRRDRNGNTAIEIIETATGNPVALIPAPAGKEFLNLELLHDGSAVLGILAPIANNPQDRALSLVRYDLSAASEMPGGGSVDPGKPSEWVADADVGRDAARIFVDSENQLVLLGGPVAGHAAVDLRNGSPRQGFADLGKSGTAAFFKLEGGRIGSVSPAMWDVRTWEAGTGVEGKQIAIPDIPPGAGNARSLTAALSPNGRYLAVGRSGVAVTDNPEVPLRVYDASTNVTLLSATWKGGSMYFTADSSRLLVAEWAGRVRWFKLPSGEPDGGWDFGPPPPEQRHLVFGVSADGSVLAYRGPAGPKGNESGPAVVDGKTSAVIRRFTKHHFASDVSLSADGRRAAVLLEIAALFCTFDIVDVTTGTSLRTIRVETGRGVPSFALAPDGSALIVHDQQTNKLRRFAVVPAKSP